MSVAKSSIKIKYIIAVILMLLFVLNDLVFDFLFNFESSDYISFACTLIAAIIVFYCNFTIKKGKITTEFENAETFIKSNFDNWQVAFSILDIICGVISILSGIALLGAIFKVVKIGYVPIKIAVVTNKGKSLVKAVSKVSLIWTSGRLLSNNENRENSSMKKIGKAFKNIGLWIYANKMSIGVIIAGVASGVTTCMTALNDTVLSFLPEIVVFGINIMPYLAGLIMFGLTLLGVQIESIKKFFDRVAKEKEQKQVEKVLKAEEKKEAQAEKEKKEIAKKQETENKKAEKLLKKLEAEQKVLQEKKAAEEAKKAEQERLLALALAMKAEKEKEQQKVDTGAN